MIRSLFRSKSMESLSQEVDEKVQNITDRLQMEEDARIEIGIDFPAVFKQQSEEIAEGKVEWRNFFSDPESGIYSIHCRMEKGAYIREHSHPGANEYIYVVTGGLVDWRGDSFSGDLIYPPEHVYEANLELESPTVRGWHRIPAGKIHRLQATQDDTHFVSKFILDG